MYLLKERVRYSETDENGCLTLMGVMNYMQDCTLFHSEDAGVGIRWMEERKRIWVLNSWQILILRLPHYGELITVGTQPYEMKKSIGKRNFLIRDEAERICVIADSNWCLIDTETMHPVKIREEDVIAYKLEERLDMPYAGRKIPVTDAGEAMEEILVRKEHLDTNHHVNNGQYIHYAMEYLPESFPVGQIRAEYKQQAVAGDRILPFVQKREHVVTVSLNRSAEESFAIVEFTEKENQEKRL